MTSARSIYHYIRLSWAAFASKIAAVLADLEASSLNGRSFMCTRKARTRLYRISISGFPGKSERVLGTLYQRALDLGIYSRGVPPGFHCSKPCRELSHALAGRIFRGLSTIFPVFTFAVCR